MFSAYSQSQKASDALFPEIEQLRPLKDHLYGRERSPPKSSFSPSKISEKAVDHDDYKDY